MSAALQVTSKNAIATLKSNTGVVIATPVVLEGWAIDEDFLTLEDTKNVENHKTKDGITVGWVMPVVIGGTITTLPGSIAQTTLQTLQDFQTNSGILVYCSLNIVVPSLLLNITYNNFVVTNCYSGVGVGSRMKDVKVTFSSDPVNTAQISSIAQLGLGLIGNL